MSDEKTIIDADVIFEIHPSTIEEQLRRIHGQAGFEFCMRVFAMAAVTEIVSGGRVGSVKHGVELLDVLSRLRSLGSGGGN